ncbi:MAG: DUF362 domain-containing protein [Gemmatimonadota bacterium]|nr:DUF362 domain-containing protein [Gemmatimonadota bacterium]
MRIDSERVYLFRAGIEVNEAPFEAYRDLAHEALRRVGLALPEDGTVLLKPNATVLFPAEKRIVTHPGFLAGMADALVEKGVDAGRLVVADGQSGEQPENGNTWKGAGYTRMADSRKLTLTELNDRPSRNVPVPGGVVFEAYPIYRDVTDCAFFFNVPLAKCHNLGCTTLAIKNLMGILARPERHLCHIQEVDRPHENGIWRLTDSGLSLFEDRFYHKLCDLVAALRSLKIPRLCMVDGLVGRDGTAFNEGENYPLGWTLIGENEVHVDAVATYLMGLDTEATPYLRFAAMRGLGSNRLDEIEVVDLADGGTMTPQALEAVRSRKTLMPIARYEDGYYDRYRADGSVVPWRIDDVNRQRSADGLEPVAI